MVTVWEPGLQYQVSAMTADPTGLGPQPVDPAAAQEVDDASKAHADRVAEDGAALAKSLGLQAEALAVADEGNVADALVELAGNETWLRSSSAPGTERPSGKVGGQYLERSCETCPCAVVLVHDD